MKFINLTPHKIVYDDGVKRIEIEPSGVTLRLQFEDNHRDFIYKLDEFAVTVYSEKIQQLTSECQLKVLNMVKRADADSIFIVSNPVAKYVKHPYVLAPDTSPLSAIRDDAGNIIGVKRFCRYA